MSKFKVGDRAKTPDGVYCGVVTHFCSRGLPVMDTDEAQDQGWPDGELDLVLAAEAPEDLTALTRRDHFAMAALTGILGGGEVEYYPNLAMQCYKIASEMEAARNKEGGD